MSEEKLSSEQVPLKFTEWLLSMGCPPEDVPPLDKISEMCRGQYYMVWRSLMEHVGPKDTIMTKRLQVFNNDIVRCGKKNVFNELDVVLPNELYLWRQHMELTALVSEAEGRVAEDREKLNQLADNVSSKLAHRNLARKKLQDAQRRSWLLQQASSELQERKAHLQETKTIAASLCCVDDSQDIEGKLEKCITALSRPATGRACVSLSVANPAASSSTVSTNGDNDAEELVSSLVKCRGDLVFKQLFERRAGLCAVAARADNTKETVGVTPQSVLAHTAALHCTLALEALKNRVHIRNTSKRLADTLNGLNEEVSGAACELMVRRGERAGAAARAGARRALCARLRAREGLFSTRQESHPESHSSAPGAVHDVDKSIISKRDELKRLIVAAAAVEMKTRNVKESLVSVFNSFHEIERLEGASQISFVNTQESISTLRQFYEEWREKRLKKMELSMDLDVSESCSYNELADNVNPKFVDELRIYLKKFSLEKNRKLILESGEKIWIFESVRSSLDRLHAKWQSDDVRTSIVCPSTSLAHNLARLAQEVATKTELEGLVRFLEDGGKKHELSLDISSIIQDEENTLDKIKKRLNECVLSLQKTEKTLNLGIDNLHIWAENTLKQHISENRTVDGRTFAEYEKAFLECLRM